MVSFCNGDEPKSGHARDLGDRLQSRNVPLATSGDLIIQKRFRIKSETKSSGTPIIREKKTLRS